MKEISANIHDAKTNLSKYLAMLESGEIDQLRICRRDEIIAEVKKFSASEKVQKRTIFPLVTDSPKTSFDEYQAMSSEVSSDYNDDFA